MKSLNELDLKDQRVLLRVDFNVPMDDGIIEDNFRIQAALPTVRFCLKQGASVVLLSHLGRPGGQPDPALSLLPVAEELEVLLKQDILFSQDCVSDQAIEVSQALPAQRIHLLENLRYHTEEEANEPDFSARLARHGNTYVNDAFGTAHRAHASNVGVVSHFRNAGIGLLMAIELDVLRGLQAKPEKPFAIVLGGAKIAGKLDLLQKLVPQAQRLIIGGGMAFTFLKSQGLNVGGSLVDDALVDEAASVLRMAREQGVDIYLPTDVVAAGELSESVAWKLISVEELTGADKGVDIGPESCSIFSAALADARTIFWNGPMGVFELPPFRTGTEMIVAAIAEATAAGAVSIVGGGDSVAAIQLLGAPKQFTHISTGGGASLELLSGRALPALEALA
ncbi:MAG: phosphoglycerate kinase [Candidatus Neomarinimicrobiota bacterium]